MLHLFHINFCTALHTVLLEFYVHLRFSRILLTSLGSALFRPLISIKWRSAVITAISIHQTLLSVLKLSPGKVAQIGQIDHLHSNTSNTYPSQLTMNNKTLKSLLCHHQAWKKKKIHSTITNRTEENNLFELNWRSKDPSSSALLTFPHWMSDVDLGLQFLFWFHIHV